MNRRIHFENLAAIAFALARLAFCGYRAFHQSVVIDEAFTFNRFVNGPWENVYSRFDANNHILFSILAKLSIQILGLSEFSLRLPSLVAGFALTLGIFYVLRLTTTPLIRWIAFLALSLHPLLLDFSVAARGYSLSLALLVWAIYFAMRRAYALCGVLLGLALSANLTIAFPASGLMLAILLLEDRPWAERFRFLATVVAPAETIFFAICFGALRTAQSTNFYVGYPTMSASLLSLAGSSLRAAPRSGLFGGDRAIRAICEWVLPLIVAFIVATSLRCSGNRRQLVPFVTLCGAVIAIIVSHYVADLNYPIDRTGMHLLLVFGLAWAIAAARVKSKLWRGSQVVLASLLAIQFATQLHARYFSDWQFDMEMRKVAVEIKRDNAGKPGHSQSVSATWLHQPSLEFYRQLLNITTLKPVRRMEPTEFSGYDFYVLSGEDSHDLDRKGIRVVFSYSRTELVLGIPAQ